MNSPQSAPDFSNLKDLLLAVARERDLSSVLERLAEGIVRDRVHVRRACVWLVPKYLPADRTRPSQFEGLHLAASASDLQDELQDEWGHASGDFSTVPFSEPLIGQVASQSQSAGARTPAEWPGGLPVWASGSGLRSYLAEPISFQGELLGVIGVFADLDASVEQSDSLIEGKIWIQIFADHAGAAIANAHAFQEIHQLRQQLEHENEYLREEVHDAHGFGEVVGNSLALRKCLGQVQLVAPTDASVLIEGESGTGKELLARAIHQHSSRRDHPLIKVNCASVPRELFESEFFGHVKGAFTSALRDRRGRFQLADGGTLFLDEVGEIPLDVQGKLLRVLQEGAFERVGDELTQEVDVRIISATNRNLEKEVASRRFREDLFYRLSVFPVEVPSLRKRMGDLPLLAQHFLTQLAKRPGMPPLKLQRKHVRILQSYAWPGNIRELWNVLERAVITSRSGSLQIDLPDRGSVTSLAVAPPLEDSSEEILTCAELRQLEQRNLRAALSQADGKIFGSGGAAEILRINPRTLLSRLKAMGIERPNRRRRSTAHSSSPASGNRSE
jgi:transcriptional regulator with GAF, ATPase, and Fis domain